MYKHNGLTEGVNDHGWVPGGVYERTWQGVQVFCMYVVGVLKE